MVGDQAGAGAAAEGRSWRPRAWEVLVGLACGGAGAGAGGLVIAVAGALG